MGTSQRAKKKRRRLQTQEYTSKSWHSDCMEFLRIITECEDSTPFRRQVSLIEYPDYRDIVDNPMDLSKIREKLSCNQYQSPVEFCKDMRLMFQNSRNYNTNKKSRIYSMTIRMSAMFEDQIRFIISDYRSAVKYEEKLKNNQFVSDRRRPVPTMSNAEAGPSVPTSRSAGRVSKFQQPSSKSSSSPSHQRPAQTASVSAAASPHLHNGYRSTGTSRIRTSHLVNQNSGGSKQSYVLQKKETALTESRSYQQLRSSISTSTSSSSVKLKSGSNTQSPLGMYSSPQVLKAVGNSKRTQIPSMVTRRQALTEQNGRVHPHTRKNNLIINYVPVNAAKRLKMKRNLPDRQQPKKPAGSVTRNKCSGLVKKNPMSSEGDDNEENESGKEVAILKRKRKKKVVMSFVKAKLIKLKKAAAAKKKVIIARPMTRSKSKVDEPNKNSRHSSSLVGVSSRRRRTVVNYKELDEGPREEEEYGTSSQDSHANGVSGSIRRRRTIVNYKVAVESFKEENVDLSSSSQDRNAPDVSGSIRRRRTVASYKEADDEEEEQNSNSCSSAGSLGHTERITRHSCQSSIGNSDSSVEFRSSRRLSKKTLEEGKPQREVRWNLRNQTGNNSFEKTDTLDHSESSNSSVATPEHYSRVSGIQQQQQTRTQHRHHHATSLSCSGSGSVSHGDSHLSNTDDGGLSDDELGVRRSSRTSTRNSTRATRSALIASSVDDLQEAPKQPLPVSQSVTSKGHYEYLKDLAGIKTRNKGQRTVRYQEDSDFDYDVVDSDASMNGDHVEDEGVSSFSGRGRRRHARRLLVN